MKIQPEVLVQLMAAVEEEDPIDYGDLAFDEDGLRKLAAIGICEILENCHDLTPNQQLLSLAAAAAKLSLENMVLHMRLDV